jgi:hypothetical protein
MKFNNVIYPSKEEQGTSVVEPYNGVLSIHGLLEYSDVTAFTTNEGLKNYSYNKL